MKLYSSFSSGFFFAKMGICNFFLSRFDKKRLEEELEVARRKVSHLRTQMEGSMVGKLQQELREYREILKCSICLDRPKEVNIQRFSFICLGVFGEYLICSILQLLHLS